MNYIYSLDLGAQPTFMNLYLSISLQLWVWLNNCDKFGDFTLLTWLKSTLLAFVYYGILILSYLTVNFINPINFIFCNIQIQISSIRLINLSSVGKFIICLEDAFKRTEIETFCWWIWDPCWSLVLAGPSCNI